jgi:hypothetical protein
MTYFNFVVEVIFLICLVGWAYDRFQKRQKPAVVIPHVRPVSGDRKLTPPPTPIDRNEFLQARIAYLAWMRNGIEFDQEEKETVMVDGEPKVITTTKKIVRPATFKEMIDFVNIRDEEHVEQLLDTWNQVQAKQRNA